MHLELELKILDMWKDKRGKVKILYSFNNEVKLNEEDEEEKETKEKENKKRV